VEALGSLWGEAPEPALEALVRALADKDPLVRADAAVSLGALGPMAAQAVPALREAAGDAHAGVRARAKAALAAIGADRT
jgi:HEAT repeat protein